MKMVRQLFGTFACLMAASLLWPDFANADPKDQLSVNVDEEDRMTITLKVGEKNVPAVLDTAATFFMVDHSVLNDFNSRPLDSPVDILGMDGVKEYPTTQIGPLVTGNTSLGTVNAAVNSKSRFIGHRTIVPLKALPGRSVDFNFEANTIKFYDRKPERQSRDNIVSRIKYEEIDGLLFVPVRLNGKPGRALIDTGSDVTYVNSAFAEASRAKLDMDKTRRLIGIASAGVQVRVFNAKRFKIGSHRMRAFDILAADPPLFQHLKMENEPMMVIGLDLLREFHLQIDRSDELVLLGRERPEGSARHFKISPQQGRVRRY